MKVLDENQKKLKLDRDKLRQQYLDYLESKGKKKKDSSGSRSGRSITSSNSSNLACSNTTDVTGANSSSGTAWSVGLNIGSAIYRKPTQVGFDFFSAINAYPMGDWSGTSETYSNVLWYETRITTDAVSDETSFNNAWTTATVVGTVYGSDSNWTTSYSSIVGIGHYTHETPVVTSGYNYQTLTKYTLSNNLLFNSTSFKATWISWTAQVELTTLSSPTVSFSQTTNDFTISSATSGTCRAIEFNRNSYTPYSGYLTSVETDICYNCSVRNQEWGIYSGQAHQSAVFALWDIGTYTVKISYDSGHPSGTRTRYSTAVDTWISEMNSAISGSGVSFERDDNTSTPDVLISTKSPTYMGNGGGYWRHYTNSDGWIYQAEIELNYDADWLEAWGSVEAVTTEELTQMCGCGGDLTTRVDCINTEFNFKYSGKSSYFRAIDEHIQNFLYNSNIYIAVGADSEDLAVLMNPSNGFVSTTTTTANAYWMEEDVTYNMRVWQANASNHYSVIPSYSSTFTPTHYPQTPGAPTISSRFQGGLNLTWTAGTYADYYKLAYSTDNTNWYYADNINTNSYAFYGLEGQTYYFKVRSCSNYNKPSSSYSSVNQGTTNPSMVTSISCTQAGTSHTVDISFSKGYSYSSYTVLTDIDWTRDTGNWGSVEYSAQSGTFYNIDVTNYNTPVYFRLRSQITVSGTDLFSDWSSTITVSMLLPQLSMPTLTFSNTTKSIACTVGSNSNATNYQININGGTIQTISNAGGTYTFDNLAHNTSYTIAIFANGDEVNYRDSATNSYSQSTNLLVTPSLPTNVVFAQIGYTQDFTITFTKGTNADYTDIDMTDSSNANDWGTVNWTNQSGTSYTFYNTGYYGTHYFRVRSLKTDGYNNVYSSWSSTYNSDFNNRPSNWAWITPIASGGNIYNTDLPNKTLYILTASEWNNFTAKINAFRAYKGLGSYSFTTVSSGTTFTKEIFNQARNALNDLSAYFTGGNTIPSVMVTGSPVLVASYYTSMRDALNSIS